MHTVRTSSSQHTQHKLTDIEITLKKKSWIKYTSKQQVETHDRLWLCPVLLQEKS